jgi:hypothetical protein
MWRNPECLIEILSYVGLGKVLDSIVNGHDVLSRIKISNLGITKSQTQCDCSRFFLDNTNSPINQFDSISGTSSRLSQFLAEFLLIFNLQSTNARMPLQNFCTR